jgi:hypothetical protein
MWVFFAMALVRQLRLRLAIVVNGPQITPGPPPRKLWLEGRPEALLEHLCDCQNLNLPDDNAIKRQAADELSLTPQSAVPLPEPFNQEPLRHLSMRDRQLFNEFGMGKQGEPSFNLVHLAFEHHAGTPRQSCG